MFMWGEYMFMWGEYKESRLGYVVEIEPRAYS